MVHQQLGDVGALLGLYDAETEENYITEAVAKGRRSVEIIPDLPRAPVTEARPSPGADGVELATDADTAELSTDATLIELSTDTASDDVDLFALLNEPDEPAGAPQTAQLVAPMNLEGLLESIRGSGGPDGAVKDVLSNLPSLFASAHELCVTALKRWVPGAKLVSLEVEQDWAALTLRIRVRGHPPVAATAELLVSM